MGLVIRLWWLALQDIRLVQKREGREQVSCLPLRYGIDRFSICQQRQEPSPPRPPPRHATPRPKGTRHPAPGTRPWAQGEGDAVGGFAGSRHSSSVGSERVGRLVGVAETARFQLAAGDLARPLVEIGAGLGAGFEEVAGRPALAAGGFAGDRAAACPVEHEIARVGSAGRVDDEAVLMAFDPGEVARVVVLRCAWCSPFALPEGIIRIW